MKGLRLIFTFATFFFLNVFVPAHTRGTLTLPGGKESCRTPNIPTCCESDGAPNEHPTPDQQKRCAVCFIVAHFTVPPVFTFDVRASDLVGERVRVVLAQRTSIDFDFPFFPCGPPCSIV